MTSAAIDELEETMNDIFAVIHTRVETVMTLTEKTGLDAFEIRANLHSIDGNCKELAKLTAKAVGLLRAYGKGE